MKALHKSLNTAKFVNQTNATGNVSVASSSTHVDNHRLITDLLTYLLYATNCAGYNSFSAGLVPECLLSFDDLFR